MIIKSLSRATKSFDALYKYLTRDRDSILNGYNLYSDVYSQKELVEELLENANFLKYARGKNYLYHEIIALNKNSLTLEEEQKILQDIANKYLSLRANNHLAFSSLHKDKEHTHIHLMISANEMMGEKRVRLSKKEFSTIQKELEQYINTTYPQLEATYHYQKQGKELSKAKNSEQALKQRSKKPSKKEELHQHLNDIFTYATTKEEFKNYSQKLGVEFYTRGQSVGVIYNNKKYRLKTLGVLEEYERAIEKLENPQQEKQQQQQTHDERFSHYQPKGDSGKSQFREEATKNSYNSQEEKQDKKVDSNPSEDKINQRREQMKTIRDSQKLDVEQELKQDSRFKK
ncbi:MAG: relaxase/mobilization nuclease domain-containing protein [Campylobacterota bacterium]|nr:relaxase/mobilization nuclease domain-containing protein [Campylobacterota bacterium]